MDKKKLSLREFIWLCFSFIAGIGFLGNMVISNSTADTADGGTGIGIHVVWILVFEGIIVGICAYAFTKLVFIHSSAKNGGAYVYGRSAFGRFTGYLIAFMQYIVLPFIIAFQIMGLIRSFFEPPYIDSNSVFNIGGNLGAFHDLIFDLIGIVIYAICAMTIFFGMKAYKKFAMLSGYIKWGTSSVLILAGIVLAFMHGKENYGYWFSKEHSHVNISNFLKTFTASFFYFVGFEQIITSTKNIESPRKTIGKGLLISMGIVTTLYVVVTFIFFGAVNEFNQNMNIGTWDLFGVKWLMYIGGIIMIVSQLALKAQVSMINGFIGGTMLQPLSEEGYISENYKTLGKDDIPVKAVKLHMLITTGVIAIWLIIPDIVNGILTTKGISSIPFSVVQMSSVTSVIVIFIYAIVLLAVFKYNKVLNLKIWEKAAFVLAFITLIINFVYHYYDLYEMIVAYVEDPTNSNSISGLVAVITELAFTFFIIVGSSLNYALYYLPKLKKRLSTNPNLQAELDSHFQLDYEQISALQKGLNVEKETFITNNN